MAYLAVIATRLHFRVPVPRDELVSITTEYQSLRDAVANQHGVHAQLLSGDDELALFHSADAAVHFALRLQDRWAQECATDSRVQSDAAVIAGAHFGECQRIEPDGPWVGAAVGLARRVREVGTPPGVTVTEAVLDLVDIAMYTPGEPAEHSFDGDVVGRRRLYRLELGADRSPQAPRSADSWFLEGAALAGTRRENTEHEAACYREALRLRQDYPEAHNNLAVLLRARGETTPAEEHYQSALNLRPDYAEAHHNYAVLLASQGRSLEAVHQYSEAMRLRPRYAPALHGYANALKALGRTVEAEDCYRQALELEPASAGIHNDYAIFLEDHGRLEEAILHYREALRHDRSPACHYNYALLMESLGDLAGAEVQYRAALELDGDHAEAHNNLAILLQQRGMLDEAEGHFLNALRLRPGDHATHHNYALLLEARDGSRADGIAAAEQIDGSNTVAGLSAREAEVLRHLARGLSNQEIADELVLSVHTVERHIANVYRKIGVRRRSEATAYAITAGLS